MSRVSKKKLLKIFKGEYGPATMTRSQLIDWLAKPHSQEEWLRGYKHWKKQQNAKN